MATYGIYHNGEWYDEVYFQGHSIDQVYIGKELVWEREREGRPDYALWLLLNEHMLPVQDKECRVDENGYYIRVNEGGSIKKCGMYLGEYNKKPILTIACTGSNIVTVEMVPYVAHRGRVEHYFQPVKMLKDKNNIYSVNGDYGLYYLIPPDESYEILGRDYDSKNARLFTDLNDMKAWLQS